LPGKRAVVRCLLELKHILDHHDVYYIFSKIWVDDFLVWIALQPDDTVRELGAALAAVRMEKRMVGWDIDALEAAVNAQRDRDSDSDDESS
jgi:protein SHQ1